MKNYNKQVRVQTNLRLEPACDECLEESARAAGESKQQHFHTIALAFWGFSDPLIDAKKTLAVEAVRKKTKGRRPFDGGAAGYARN